MFDFHGNVERYFGIQQEVTAQYIIPFLSQVYDLSDRRRILEVGCGEAGVLKAFLEAGHDCTGIELSSNRSKRARSFLSSEIEEGRALIINDNIYEIDPAKFEKFDVIILKDVIEHIPDQERFIPFLRTFLSTDGIIFFGFPPWYMPFGGHQQISRNKWLSKLPWVHLLPKPIYLWIYSKLAKDKDHIIKELGEIKDTGISIERLNRILKKNDFQILLQKYWFINPIYKFKFGLKPRKVPALLTKLPFIRNLYTTALYVIFK